MLDYAAIPGHMPDTSDSQIRRHLLVRGHQAAKIGFATAVFQSWFLPGSWNHIRMESYMEQPEGRPLELYPEATRWNYIRGAPAGNISRGPMGPLESPKLMDTCPKSMDTCPKNKVRILKMDARMQHRPLIACI